MDKKVLLVEGPNDELFFSNFCQVHGYDVHVKVKKPSSVAPDNKDNKQGVLQLLQVYIKLLAPNSVEKLGVIVDADYATSGGGVQTTLTQIHNKIKEHGYTSSAIQLSDTSYYFEKDDKSNRLSIWIMPNNLDEGYLEHWITNNIEDNEKTYFNKISDFIDNFDEKKIGPIQIPKAKVQIWLACQRKPLQDMRTVIHNNYLDQNKQQYLNFKNWLSNTFI
jgi:hypothetical protein